MPRRRRARQDLGQRPARYRRGRGGAENGAHAPLLEPVAARLAPDGVGGESHIRINRGLHTTRRLAARPPPRPAPGRGRRRIDCRWPEPWRPFPPCRLFAAGALPIPCLPEDSTAAHWAEHRLALPPSMRRFWAGRGPPPNQGLRLPTPFSTVPDTARRGGRADPAARGRGRAPDIRLSIRVPTRRGIPACDALPRPPPPPPPSRAIRRHPMPAGRAPALNAPSLSASGPFCRHPPAFQRKRVVRQYIQRLV